MTDSHIEQLRVDEIRLNPDWPYRKQLLAIEGLAASMAKENGLIQPIGVSTEGFLVWGRRRLEAAKKLGWETISCLVVDMDDPLTAMKDENENRVNITASELTALMRAIEANERAKAKARMSAGKKAADPVELIPQGQEIPDDLHGSGRSRDKIGEILGVSGKTVDALKKIDESAAEEVKAAVDAGEVTITDAAKVADKPKATQKKALDAKRKGKARTVSGAAKQIEENPPAEPDEAAWVDAWGIPITKEAADAFRNQEKFDELLKVLRQAKKLYKELAELPGGQFLQQGLKSANTKNGFLSKAIDTAIMDVKDSRPTYTVCPYAYNSDQPHDKECSFCKGLGWLSDVNLECIAKEMIEAAKKEHGVA